MIINLRSKIDANLSFFAAILTRSSCCLANDAMGVVGFDLSFGWKCEKKKRVFKKLLLRHRFDHGSDFDRSVSLYRSIWAGGTPKTTKDRSRFWRGWILIFVVRSTLINLMSQSSVSKNVICFLCALLWHLNIDLSQILKYEIRQVGVKVELIVSLKSRFQVEKIKIHFERKKSLTWNKDDCIEMSGRVKLRRFIRAVIAWLSSFGEKERIKL